MKKIILSILVILWMILIFLFSNQTGVDSNKASDGIVERGVKTAEVIRKKEYPKNDRKIIIDKVIATIRKIAHFTEYFVLGVLVYFMFKEYSVKHVFIYSILFCLIYSISDEVHQLFISERSAKFLDVLIDTSGSILSNIIIYSIKKYK